MVSGIRNEDFIIIFRLIQQYLLPYSSIVVISDFDKKIFFYVHTKKGVEYLYITI